MSLNNLDGSWFSEVNEVLWKGQALSLQMEKVLHEEQSQYQSIRVMQSTTYGKVLILDGAIQLTERDEFAYHEMMAHLPLCSHPDPKNVLIVGGGDGGVAREVLKHSSVERCVICDIDERVTAVSRQWFPSISNGAFDDKRMQLEHVDGAKYLQEHLNEFDVIITDSSDPIGPAETLYSGSYFAALQKSLRDGGIVAQQGECLWLDSARFPAKIVCLARQNFPLVDYAVISIPTYPCGQIGCLLASKSGLTNFRQPSTTTTLNDKSADNKFLRSLKYYNSDIHHAAFALPTFARNALDSALKRDGGDADISLRTTTLVSVQPEPEKSGDDDDFGAVNKNKQDDFGVYAKQNSTSIAVSHAPTVRETK